MKKTQFRLTVTSEKWNIFQIFVAFFQQQLFWFIQYEDKSTLFFSYFILRNNYMLNSAQTTKHHVTEKHLHRKSWKMIWFFSPCYLYYGNMGCKVFKPGVQNQKDFCLRINILKGNYWILIIGLVGASRRWKR